MPVTTITYRYYLSTNGNNESMALLPSEMNRGEAIKAIDKPLGVFLLYVFSIFLLRRAG